jgi:hypothetical protein
MRDRAQKLVRVFDELAHPFEGELGEQALLLAERALQIHGLAQDRFEVEGAALLRATAQNSKAKSRPCSGQLNLTRADGPDVGWLRGRARSEQKIPPNPETGGRDHRPSDPDVARDAVLLGFESDIE